MLSVVVSALAKIFISVCTEPPASELTPGPRRANREKLNVKSVGSPNIWSNASTRTEARPLNVSSPVRQALKSKVSVPMPALLRSPVTCTDPLSHGSVSLTATAVRISGPVNMAFIRCSVPRKSPCRRLERSATPTFPAGCLLAPTADTPVTLELIAALFPPKTVAARLEALAVVSTATFVFPEYWTADAEPPPPPPPPPQAANSNNTTGEDNSRANFNLQVDMTPPPKRIRPGLQVPYRLIRTIGEARL